MSGIYIHIPFCRQACTYCDFHFSTSTRDIEALIHAIEKELVLQRNYLGDEVVETIYFGGGTPSLVDVKLIRSLLKTVRENFRVASEAEITLEANPDDLDEKKASELKESGVNRLSIGIQSFSDDELRFMNRAHNASQALKVVDVAQKSGFDNISIDLIYGIPNSQEDQWRKNVEIALDLGVDHLSCYAMTVEERTVLADMIRKKKVFPAEEEKVNADFELLMEMTSSAGFEHYEISNFARSKKYSRHNTSYWEDKKYLGVGPSAHSYDKESRQWSIRNNQQYIRSLEENKIPFESEILTIENKFNEYILTSLRTMWGIDISMVEQRFGKKVKEDLLKQMKIYLEGGEIHERDGRFILSNKGKFFADKIASDLFIS